MLQNKVINSRLAQLVERVTSNDEVSRSSRLMGTFFYEAKSPQVLRSLGLITRSITFAPLILI